MDTKATRSLKIFIAALALQGPLAVADPEPELLARCVRCHAVDAAAASPATPSLDGQLHSYLTESIDLLIVGKRRTSVADHFPPDLSRAQIIALASHYSQLPARRGDEEIDRDKALLGELLYMERCMACHEDNGRSTDNKGLGAPILAGQKMNYLRAQLLAYLKRERDYLIFMKESVFAGRSIVINGHSVREPIGALAPEDVDALAHFFASVQPSAPNGRRRR